MTTHKTITVVRMTEGIRTQVQTALDQLMSEHLIPFKLTAQRVTISEPGKYFVPFFDSRIHSFEFSWTEANPSPFNEVVRAAILARVQIMDPPPATAWIPSHLTPQSRHFPK